MKILHIINDLRSGGAEKMLELTVPLQAEIEDFEVEVLLLSSEKNVYYESFKNKNIKVMSLSYKQMFNPLYIFKIKNIIKKGSYDIVHTHLFPTQYWAAMAKKIDFNRNYKLITTEHSPNNKRRNKKIYLLLEKMIYSFYDCVISISEGTQESILKHLKPKDKKKYIKINNGVNLELINKTKPYDKAKLIPTISSKNTLVGMIGRFEEPKDQKTVIKAMTLLDEDVHLILLGEGDQQSECEKLVDELKLSERIHFLGYRQDALEILKTLDVIVLSSHWEGLSLSSMEGLASGKPFIASKVSGLTEIVENHGLLFEKNDYEQLARHIKKLLSDEQYYEEIVKRCKERASDFDLNKTIHQLENVYRQITKKNEQMN